MFFDVHNVLASMGFVMFVLVFIPNGSSSCASYGLLDGCYNCDDPGAEILFYRNVY